MRESRTSSALNGSSYSIATNVLISFFLSFFGFRLILLFYNVITVLFVCRTLLFLESRDDIVNAGRAWIASREYDLASWQAHAQLSRFHAFLRRCAVVYSPQVREHKSNVKSTATRFIPLSPFSAR